MILMPRKISRWNVAIRGNQNGAVVALRSVSCRAASTRTRAMPVFLRFVDGPASSSDTKTDGDAAAPVRWWQHWSSASAVKSITALMKGPQTSMISLRLSRSTSMHAVLHVLRQGLKACHARF